MWQTLATLELALGCLYPIMVACQHNFPPDAEVRKTAFSALQSYCAGLGYAVQLLQTRSEVHKNFNGNIVSIFLPDKIAYVALADDCLMVFLKQYLSSIAEPFWTARLDTRYWFAESAVSSLLPSDWWQSVVSALQSGAQLNREE